MDLLGSLNRKGKTKLVYIDAEFQTYRVSNKNDPLAAKGFVATPYDFGMSEGNFGNNKYHFLLNLGFIVIDEHGHSSHFAMFSSKFNSGNGFENPQILEPGYTTCKPFTDYRITEKRAIVGKAGTFPYYASFLADPEKQAAFEDISEIYNSSISDGDKMESYATLTYFLKDIAPKAMIVHKGRNDLWALYNTARLLKIPMPTVLTRDLDRVALRLPGLRSTKLDIVQRYFTMPAPLPNNITEADPVHLRLHKIKDILIDMRDMLLDEIRDFFISKWGAPAGDVAAHNPLVDCVYAAVIDLGLGSSASAVVSEYGIDSSGVLRFAA